MRIPRTFFAILGMVAALAGSSFAATQAAFVLQGSIGGDASLTVTPQSGYNALDLTVDQSADLLIAIVNEQSNYPHGYTVTLASTMAETRGGGTQAMLVGGLGNSDTLDYFIKYGGVSVILSEGSALVTEDKHKTHKGGVNKNLTITYAASGKNLSADTYSDTLTLTVAAK